MPDTGLKSPSANGDDYTGWTNPANAYASDDADTYPAAAGNDHDWYNFAFSIPAGATIDGIEVLIEGAQNSPGGTSSDDVELSWDGGASYTTSGKSVSFTGTTDTTQTAGGAADTWGRAWSDTELSDTNFRIRLDSTSTKREDIDHIQVKVYYTEAVVAGYASVF